MRQNMRSIAFRSLYRKSEKQFFHFRFALGEIIGERSQHMTGVFTAVEAGFTP